MYDGLYAACERADCRRRIRVLVLRGAGDKAFVAGTDIAPVRLLRQRRRRRRLRGGDHPRGQPAGGRHGADGRRGPRVLRGRRPRDRRRVRPAGGHPVGPVRRAHRPHARQLPVDEHLLAAASSTSDRPGPSTSCCGPGCCPARTPTCAGFVSELCDDDALDRGGGRDRGPAARARTAEHVGREAGDGPVPSRRPARRRRHRRGGSSAARTSATPCRPSPDQAAGAIGTGR